MPRQPFQGGRIEIALEYREHVPRFACVARRVEGAPLERGYVGAGVPIPFQLALPADAEPEIRVERGSVTWWVVARAAKRDSYREVPLLRSSPRPR